MDERDILLKNLIESAQVRAKRFCAAERGVERERERARARWRSHALVRARMASPSDIKEIVQGEGWRRRTPGTR